MNVEIGTEAPIFLFWEYLFQNFGILSLQCRQGCYLTPREKKDKKTVHRATLSERHKTKLCIGKNYGNSDSRKIDQVLQVYLFTFMLVNRSFNSVDFHTITRTSHFLATHLQYLLRHPSLYLATYLSSEPTIYVSSWPPILSLPSHTSLYLANNLPT